MSRPAQVGSFRCVSRRLRLSDVCLQTAAVLHNIAVRPRRTYYAACCTQWKVIATLLMRTSDPDWLQLGNVTRTTKTRGTEHVTEVQ